MDTTKNTLSISQGSFDFCRKKYFHNRNSRLFSLMLFLAACFESIQITPILKTCLFCCIMIIILWMMWTFWTNQKVLNSILKVYLYIISSSYLSVISVVSLFMWQTSYSSNSFFDLLITILFEWSFWSNSGPWKKVISF